MFEIFFDWLYDRISMLMEIVYDSTIRKIIPSFREFGIFTIPKAICLFIFGWSCYLFLGFIRWIVINLWYALDVLTSPIVLIARMTFLGIVATIIFHLLRYFECI